MYTSNIYTYTYICLYIFKKIKYKKITLAILIRCRQTSSSGVQMELNCQWREIHSAWNDRVDIKRRWRIGYPVQYSIHDTLGKWELKPADNSVWSPSFCWEVDGTLWFVFLQLIVPHIGIIKGDVSTIYIYTTHLYIYISM